MKQLMLIGLAACLACSPPSQNVSKTTTDVTRSGQAMKHARLETFPTGFPLPAAILEGMFAMREACLAFQPVGAARWYLAVVPHSTQLIQDHSGGFRGVRIDGVSTNFGEKVRVGGGISPYSVDRAASGCTDPTVIIGSILR